MSAAPASPRTSPPHSPTPGSPVRPRANGDLDRDSDSFSSDDDRRGDVHAFDSSAALILVPDDDHDDDHDLEAHEHEHDQATFDFSSDDDNTRGADDYTEDAALLHRRSPSSSPPPYRPGYRPRPATIPPLSSLTVFLYLLSPLLKLGALLSLDEKAGMPLPRAIGALLFFGGLCALTRQVWYMLARYVRRADMEDVLLETFARGRERERKRRVVRRTVKACTGVLRVLLVGVYLRASTDALLPLLSSKLLGVFARPVLALVLALAALPLCLASSLDATSVLYATWFSVASYTGWVACTAYAHAQGVRFPITDGEAQSLGPLWQGFSIAAFTFTTSSTLPLYAALKGTHQPSVPKPRRSRSFKLISTLSIALATLLIIPPTVFRCASASEFRVQFIQDRPPTPEPNPGPGDNQTEAPLPLKALMALLSVLTLMLGVPSTLITAPPFPVPLAIRRSVSTGFPASLSRTMYVVLAFVLAGLPAAVCRVTSDVLLVLALLSTYAVPALIHITIHNFRRPLAIVMPPAPATPATPNHPGMQRSESYNDELLQRKERTLQRRRLVRRIAWDVGVWVLLVPVSGGGVVWALGRVLGRW